MRTIIGAITLATLLAASNAPAAADPPAPTTRQALYDDAQNAFDRDDWAGAVSGFTAVLAGMTNHGRSEGIIRNRLAVSLLAEGQTEEAKSQAAEAVADLRAVTSGPDADLADAYLTQGDVLQSNLDYEDAIQAYQQAKASATGPDAADQATAAKLGIIKSAMVTHPDLAASTADAVLADDKQFNAEPRTWQTQILTLRARAELNRGDPRAASHFADRALSLSGAMSERITLFQVAVRGDAALIYELLHDDEYTRHLLAYTGAGHLPSENWFFSADVDPPPCGADIQPDDTAVVEFAIGDDGRTVSAAPVYASRPGQMGVEFARAVRGWRWPTSAVKKLDPFWRASMRIQIRCRHTLAATPRPALPTGADPTSPAPADRRNAAALGCETFPGRPHFVAGQPNDSAFPEEAQSWGFQGHVLEAAAIGDHGQVLSTRTLIAYPPFVFAPAAEKMVRLFGFSPAAPAAIAAGCNEVAIRLNYDIPGR